ncbi:hypothetical protein [uncultured Akkermansia sp.]|uniref:hypothetical protein n=1 Tax=uncultured Akkermansia sp. TaxID=512294 RepID=UPI0025F24990|nr:hypothetical protein [uncultured Akkermansia sp.]
MPQAGIASLRLSTSGGVREIKEKQQISRAARTYVQPFSISAIFLCDENVTEKAFPHFHANIASSLSPFIQLMNPHAKSLNERLRTLISLIFGLVIGCALLFGETRWEHTPSLRKASCLLPASWPASAPSDASGVPSTSQAIKTMPW